MQLAFQGAVEHAAKIAKIDQVPERPSILIVEDEAVLADVLRTAFVGSGWEVALADCMEAAIGALTHDAFEIVLVDKNLPDGSGVELVRRIRARDEAVGVVLMTAYGTVESARETLNLGVDEYLEKPFADILAVVSRLEELRTRARARRKSAPGSAGRSLTVIVAAVDPARRAALAQALQHNGDRVLHLDHTEEIRPTAKNEHADLLVLDGKSFPAEITCLVVEAKARVKRAACVVLSESLSLEDVKRLIQLEVKALIDHPLEGEKFTIALKAAVERVRRSRH